MYDRGRWFRALVMGVTLLACLWVIRQILASKHAGASPAVASAGINHPPEPIARGETEPVVAIAQDMFPLVAFENTCMSGNLVDLSECTRFLSGAEGDRYRFEIETDLRLSVEVAPLDGFFDAAVAVYGSGSACVIGSDEQPMGLAERVVTPELTPGVYEIVVGGYAEGCGPYRLTVTEPQELVSRVVHTSTTAGRNGLALRWETFGETDLSHFVVYRRAAVGREQVAIIRGQGGPARAAHYRCMDRSVLPAADYELVAVARDGRTRTFYLPAG